MNDLKLTSPGLIGERGIPAVDRAVRPPWQTLFGDMLLTPGINSLFWRFFTRYCSVNTLRGVRHLDAINLTKTWF